MKITLTRPGPYKDTELHELTADFDTLTGNDLISAEENMRRNKPDAQLWGTLHIAHIAAKASHIPAEVILKLCAKDFIALSAGVMNFFGAISSEVSAPELTDD